MPEKIHVLVRIYRGKEYEPNVWAFRSEANAAALEKEITRDHDDKVIIVRGSITVQD